MRPETNNNYDYGRFKVVLDPLLKIVNRDDKDWELTITKIGDHYIFEVIPGTYVEKTKWIVDNDLEMLNEVGDYFGVFGSKHDKERIRIILERKEEK